MSNPAISIDFFAADPNRYANLTASDYLKAHGAFPAAGRLDGSLAAYLPGSEADLRSLAPQKDNPAVGQIVVWDVVVSVAEKSGLKDGTATNRLDFGTMTVAGADYGFDTTAGRGVVAAYVDTSAQHHADAGATATVTGLHWTAPALAAGSTDWLQGDITLGGLDAGDQVTLELWTVLRDGDAGKFTGVVQSRIDSAWMADGTVIDVGTQTIPLKLQGADPAKDGGSGYGAAVGGAAGSVPSGGSAPATPAAPIPPTGDSLYGSGQDDSLKGGAGHDVLFGNGGHDRFDGGAGDDTLHGGNDADTMLGGEGNDVAYGNDGADDITGGAGTDLIYGGGGADTLRGDADGIVAQPGTGYDDLIESGAGDDQAFGGLGNDEIQGEGGNDTITGGRDDGRLGFADVAHPNAAAPSGVVIGDNLYGNDGSDLFLYGKGDGVDLLWDFDAAQDTLQVSGYRLADITVTFVGAVTDAGRSNGHALEVGSHQKLALILDTAGDAIILNDQAGRDSAHRAFRFDDGSFTEADLLGRIHQPAAVAAPAPVKDVSAVPTSPIPGGAASRARSRSPRTTWWTPGCRAR